MSSHLSSPWTTGQMPEAVNTTDPCLRSFLNIKIFNQNISMTSSSFGLHALMSFKIRCSQKILGKKNRSRSLCSLRNASALPSLRAKRSRLSRKESFSLLHTRSLGCQATVTKQIFLLLWGRLKFT